MEVLPLTGGDRRPVRCWPSGCGPAAGSAWSPTATCPGRASRSTSSARPPGCRPARRCWPRPPAPPLLPVGTWFTDDGWGQRIGPPIELAGGRLGDRVRAATQALADAFAEPDRRAPGGLAHAAEVLAGRPDRPRADVGGQADADRHRLPVLLGHPRRGAGARPRPGRDASSRWATRCRCWRPGDEDDARPAGLRGDRGQGGADPVQRLGRPAAVRAGVGRPGAALAARRRVRRRARARAGRRPACRCWPA